VSDARNSITAKDSHIWTLRIVTIVLAILLAGQTYVYSLKQNKLTVHVPPDLSAGASLTPDKLQPANTYAFASYVWSGINDWAESGKSDYLEAINEHSCLVSDDFLQYLKRNHSQKKSDGELDRTRTLSPLLQYRQNFVVPIGNNSFSVALVMRLVERVGAMSVKDTGMQYQFRITPDARPCNPYKMQIDGFVVDPVRYESDENSKGKN
jgi:integrating conjugative element protein (TIGR03746 family)